MIENSYQWANDGWGGHIVVCLSPFWPRVRCAPSCFKLTGGTLQGPSLIHITPLLSTDEARTSMQPAIDFVTAHGGSVTIQEFPSYLAFFTQYVTAAQAVRASPRPFPRN